MVAASGRPHLLWCQPHSEVFPAFHTLSVHPSIPCFVLHLYSELLLTSTVTNGLLSLSFPKPHSTTSPLKVLLVSALLQNIHNIKHVLL